MIHQHAILLLSLIIGSPLLSFVVCIAIPRQHSKFISIFSTLLLLLASIPTLLVLVEINDQPFLYFTVNWFTIATKPLLLGFLIDQYAIAMILVVVVISFLVHLYSIAYMKEDSSVKKYFAMLGFFTFAMLGLVMSSNLLLTFCFWELVGFSSYQLISHWQERPEASAAATKAFIMNRVGDLGFIVALMILWTFVGDLDIRILQQASLSPGWQTAVGLCLFVGVVGKSAQVPLFTWLPDAMEGPTPVSALIHAATMVAAGVFLLFRLNFLFTAEAFAVVAIIGAITTLAGALAALFQYDIKKILAYSTISQLGFMVMAMVTNHGTDGFHHLLNHAFFKAGLFLCAGSLIYALHKAHKADNNWDVQDIRNLGGLRARMPVTFYCFILCSAALAGIPFTSGFISKEIILTELTAWAGDGLAWRWFIPLAGWVVTFLTPLYIFRLVFYVFLGDQSKPCTGIRESGMMMLVPMIILSLGSLALTAGIHYSFNSWLLSSHPSTAQWIFFTSTLLISLSLIAGYLLYRKKPAKDYWPFLTQNFMIDRIYDFIILGPVNFISRLTGIVDLKIIDRIIHVFAYSQVMIARVVTWSDRVLLDGLINGSVWAANGIGNTTRSVAGGRIQSYLLWAMAVLIIFIALILF